MTNYNNYANSNNGMKGKGHIVALALAGVLALGGAGAFFASGVIGRAPSQAPVVTQTATAKTPAKSTAKKAETKKTAAQKQARATPKQAEAPTPAANNSGLEAKLSREECIAKACAHVGAGGQAKGEAKNVTAKKVVGGGTVYYSVELDLGDVHYNVQVDAIDDSVISSDQVFAGTRTLLDKDANPVEGTEQPADA